MGMRRIPTLQINDTRIEALLNSGYDVLEIKLPDGFNGCFQTISTLQPTTRTLFGWRIFSRGTGPVRREGVSINCWATISALTQLGITVLCRPAKRIYSCKDVRYSESSPIFDLISIWSRKISSFRCCFSFSRARSCEYISLIRCFFFLQLFNTVLSLFFVLASSNSRGFTSLFSVASDCKNWFSPFIMVWPKREQRDWKFFSNKIGSRSRFAI